IDIYSQHAHQSLLKTSQQRKLLDAFAGTEAKAEEVRQLAQRYQQIAAQIETLSSHRDEQTARVQLLSYQVEELDRLGLQSGELEALEIEQRQLANGEQIL